MTFYHWGFVLLGALLLVLLLIYSQQRRDGASVDHVTTALAAIESCNRLLELMAHIQQHRGMSSAWLAGDKNFGPALRSKRSDIAPLIEGLQQQAEAERIQPDPCFTPVETGLWAQRWNALVTEFEGSTIEKSIAAHSNLIATLLTWLGALGEARIEARMGTQRVNGMVLNYSQRLPQLAETLGQARAAGSGVAALGSCSAVMRVRLMFLVSRAESLIEQAAAVDREGSEAVQHVRSLALMIRSQMLSHQKVSVGADEYYREATRAIDAVFHWVHATGQALEKELRQVTAAAASTRPEQRALLPGDPMKGTE